MITGQALELASDGAALAAALAIAGLAYLAIAALAVRRRRSRERGFFEERRG